MRHRSGPTPNDFSRAGEVPNDVTSFGGRLAAAGEGVARHMNAFGEGHHLAVVPAERVWVLHDDPVPAGVGVAEHLLTAVPVHARLNVVVDLVPVLRGRLLVLR